MEEEEPCVVPCVSARPAEENVSRKTWLVVSDAAKMSSKVGTDICLLTYSYFCRLGCLPSVTQPSDGILTALSVELCFVYKAYLIPPAVCMLQ